MSARPHRLLIVCSGNICRSPLAHAMAVAWARDRGLPLDVRSAGTLGLVDRPAAKGMITVAAEVGLDLKPHRSQALTLELVDWADTVGVMETAHAMAIRELAPHAPVEKLVPMGPLVGKAEIADPVGSWTLKPFRVARDEIRGAVEQLLDQLAKS